MSINERFNKKTGESVAADVARYPNELDRDAVGLFQIVPQGRVNFGLSGTDLDDYVRLAVRALLSAGAVPVRGERGSGYQWIAQKQYGDIQDQIVEGIISEWRTMPGDPVMLCTEGVWFARPRTESPFYVKMD